MVVAMVIAIGPLVWAIGLDARDQRFEREVLSDIEELPVLCETVDGLPGGARLTGRAGQDPGQ
ncbi:MAG: hypothetical protein M0Z42_02745 [Actinomycetota bacterium]|nr:hypothetical protein [Actinomycetota bacterium]